MCFGRQKKPKCERDFASAHRQIQKRIASQPGLCAKNLVEWFPLPIEMWKASVMRFYSVRIAYESYGQKHYTKTRPTS